MVDQALQVAHRAVGLDQHDEGRLAIERDGGQVALDIIGRAGDQRAEGDRPERTGQQRVAIRRALARRGWCRSARRRRGGCRAPPAGRGVRSASARPGGPATSVCWPGGQGMTMRSGRFGQAPAGWGWAAPGQPPPWCEQRGDRQGQQGAAADHGASPEDLFFGRDHAAPPRCRVTRRPRPPVEPAPSRAAMLPAGRAGAAIARGTATTMTQTPITLARWGSFHVGGREVVVAGQPRARGDLHPRRRAGADRRRTAPTWWAGCTRR